jgi:hypothetical protein
MVLLGPADQSYDEAALYCNKHHPDLFHVTNDNDTNVGMLFSSLGVQRKAVWTVIYKSKSLSTFLDIKRYPHITPFVLITELTLERKCLLLLAEECFLSITAGIPIGCR